MKTNNLNENRYSEAVNYYNNPFVLLKAPDGSPHTTSFADLYDRVQPFCRKIGLRRLNNLTGLDRIGIPVVNAIRPNLAGMSVAHGKGVTLEGSKASALMESLERYHGFMADLAYLDCSYEELSRHHNTIPLNRLDLCKRSAFNPGLSEKWVRGWDLMGGQEVMVPLRLTLLRRLPNELDSFAQSSNGLACSLEFLESLTQALLEVIERDALTCQHFLMRAHKQPFPLTRVRLESITSPLLKDLLLKIENAGVMPGLFDCTVDTEIPTYECTLFDIKDPKMIMCRGMGAALDVDTAMVRAITEAVQARAVYLSGCRETFFASEMMPASMQNISALLKALEKRPSDCRDIDACERLSIKTGSFEEDINICLEKLKKIGIEQVIVVDLTEKGAPFAALRVIVPGLEGCDDLLNFSPGSRAKKNLEI